MKTQSVYRREVSDALQKRKAVLYLLQKAGCDRRKGLVSVPDQIQPRFQRRRQRAKGESAFRRGVYKLVEGKQQAQALACEHRRVVRQPEGALQVKLRKAVAGPLCDVSSPSLFGDEKRFAYEVRWGN